MRRQPSASELAKRRLARSQQQMTYRCKVCNSVVTKNYDHVGDCDLPGGCSGTFTHQDGDRAPRATRSCRLRFGDVPHRHVVTDPATPSR